MLVLPGAALGHDCCPKTKAEYKKEIKARATAAEIVRYEDLLAYAVEQAEETGKELAGIDPVKMPNYHKAVLEEYRYWSDLWESYRIELQKLERRWLSEKRNEH